MKEMDYELTSMDFIDLHLYMHIIIAVKGRSSFITPEMKEEVESYLTEMVEVNEHKIHAICCLPDHTHILISWNPNFSTDDLVEELKGLSKHFIQYRGWIDSFEWQEGYGAFTESESLVPALIAEIHQQPGFHTSKTFREEFVAILQKNEIEYKEDELFEFYD